MQVELYAGNLHNGGAVGVAATFFDQLPILWQRRDLAWIDHLTVVASPSVASEMSNQSALQEMDRVNVTVSEDLPNFRAVRRRQRSADVRFTVFGPAYEGRRASVEVLGFADGSILPAYPDVDPLRFENARIRTRNLVGLKRRLKLVLLKRSDVFVVQTPQMAAALGEIVCTRNIHVVPNIVPAAFHDKSRWRRFQLPDRLPGEVRLFYPARGYPHKNHGFIPSVCDSFRATFGVPLRIVVTLRKEEAQALGVTGNHHFINVGEVSVADCPSLYKQTDGLFFPSLNETSSSSPMEALFMGKPVFAPDLPFMRVMTNAYASFYSNADSRAAADAIYSGVRGDGRFSPEIAQGIAWARRLPTPIAQAQEYLSVLRRVADEKTGYK